MYGLIKINQTTIFHKYQINQSSSCLQMSGYKSSRLVQQSYVQKKQKLYSPNKNVIYSGLNIEDDQKHIIIQKLREQLMMLKKNKSQLQVLQQTYSKLSSQHNKLSCQKKSNDIHFGKHHQSCLKQISILKDTSHAMKVQYRQKKVQIQDLQMDENTLRNQVDLKAVENQKLTSQLRAVKADMQQLSYQSNRLQEIHTNVRNDREKQTQHTRKLNIDLDNINKKIDDLTKYLAQLKTEQQKLTREIQRFQDQNNRLDINIQQTLEDTSALNQQIEDCNYKVQSLRQKIAQTTNQSERFKSQSLHLKKCLQTQVMRSNDTQKNLRQSQNILKVRLNQVSQGHLQLQHLNQQNISICQINSQLQSDLQSCRLHLQNLSSLNGSLLQHMNNFSQEDQQVRHVIDRKAKVQKAQQRVEQTHRKDLKQMDRTRDSIYSSRRYY